MSFSNKELEGEGEELAFAEAELASSALGRIALQTGVFPRKFHFVIWHNPKLCVISVGAGAAESWTSLCDVLSAWRRAWCRQESLSRFTASVILCSAKCFCLGATDLHMGQKYQGFC